MAKARENKLAFGIFAASAFLIVLCNCDQDSSAIRAAFRKEEIVSDVVPQAPEDKITVKYPNNKVVNLGNELKPSEVKNAPQVRYSADEEDFYTLIMTDPDAPSRRDPKLREWQHWVVGNIPGSDVKSGDTVSEYVGSAPPKNTGLHRYVFLLYKQPKKLQFDEPRRTRNDRKDRGGFSAKKFAEKYNLGQPVAGNFFQAQFEG